MGNKSDLKKIYREVVTQLMYEKESQKCGPGARAGPDDLVSLITSEMNSLYTCRYPWN